MSDYEQKLQENRVIGIRHALRAFKNDGLLDDDTFYPDDAVDEIKDDMLWIARKWYRIGARRGAVELLDAFLNGDFEVKTKKNGKIEIVANKDAISWKRGLNVSVGNEKRHLKRRKYSLKIKKDLGFE